MPHVAGLVGQDFRHACDAHPHAILPAAMYFGNVLRCTLVSLEARIRAHLLIQPALPFRFACTY